MTELYSDERLFVRMVCKDVLFMLIATLMFSNIPAQSWEGKYLITQFQVTPGVYFEQVGQVQVYNNELTLVIVLDLNHHMEKLDQLNYYYTKIVEICNNPKIAHYRHFPTVCSIFIKTVEQNLLKLQEDKSILEQMVGYYPIRNKRAYFDAVGSLAKTLFGTLDVDDRNYYNDQIKRLTEGEKTLTKLIQDQTIIMKSTISNFNTSINDLAYNEKLLTENVNKLEKRLQDNTAHINTLEIKLIIEEYVEIFDLILQQFQLETLTLSDSVLVAQRGQLHPNVISPFKFMLELQKLVPDLPNELNFPIPLTMENTHVLLNLISLAVYFNSGNLVYVISVPLTSDNNFNILKLTPFPNYLLGNKYTFIQPKADYLAASVDKQQYFLLTINDLQSCHKYEHTQYLCKQLQPIYLAHRTELCEMQLFSAVKEIPESCDKRMTEIRSNLFTQLMTTTAWLFIIPETEILTLSCKNLPTKDVSLSGVGKLWLDKSCTASSSTTTLKPHGKILGTNVSLDFVPDVDLRKYVTKSLSATNINISNLKLIKNYKDIVRNLQDLKFSSYRLDEIQEISKSLEHELNTKLVVNHHSYFIATVAVILALLIFYFIVRKLLSMKWNFKSYNFQNPTKTNWHFQETERQPQTETL